MDFNTKITSLVENYLLEAKMTSNDEDAIKNFIGKMSHHKVDDIIEMIRQRYKFKVDSAFVKDRLPK